MKTNNTYQIKEVTQLTGVTTRTLHHYDAIGLLRPAARTSSGYRLYFDDNLFRLQQILIGRELGLILDEIRQSLDDKDFDLKASLLTQRRILRKQKDKTMQMLKAVDAAIRKFTSDKRRTMVAEASMFEGFNPEEYKAEVIDKWGKTEMYAESQKRTKS